MLVGPVEQHSGALLHIHHLPSAHRAARLPIKCVCRRSVLADKSHANVRSISREIPLHQKCSMRAGRQQAKASHSQTSVDEEVGLDQALLVRFSGS